MGFYNGRQLLTIRPNFVEVRRGQLDDHTFEVQASGTGTPWKTTEVPKRTIEYPFLLEGAAEIKALRMQISALRGRQRGIYVPGYTTDFAAVIDAAAGQKQITVQKVGLATARATFNQYQHVAVITAEKLECYQVSNVTVSGDNEVLTLSTNLLTDLIANQTVCTPLLFARLFDDKAKFKFESDGVATITLKFVELPQEYSMAHLGQTPLWLYQFTRGPLVNRYVDFGKTITTLDAVSFAPANISFDSLSSDIEVLGSGPMLSVGTDDPNHPLRYYATRLALEPTNLDLYYIDSDLFPDGFNLSDATLIYTGRHSAINFKKKGVIEAEATSILRLSERQWPNLYDSRTCPLITYGDRCGVNINDFTTSGVVLEITEEYVSAQAFADKANAQSDQNWFALGTVTIGTQKRFVTGQVGAKLYVNAPFLGTIDTGTPVSAVAGDDHRIGTCQLKFNNLDNCLAFTYKPNRNPQYQALDMPKTTGGKKG